MNPYKTVVLAAISANADVSFRRGGGGIVTHVGIARVEFIVSRMVRLRCATSPQSKPSLFITIFLVRAGFRLEA